MLDHAVWWRPSFTRAAGERAACGTRLANGRLEEAYGFEHVQDDRFAFDRVRTLSAIRVVAPE